MSIKYGTGELTCKCVDLIQHKSSFDITVKEQGKAVYILRRRSVRISGTTWFNANWKLENIILNTTNDTGISANKVKAQESNQKVQLGSWTKRQKGSVKKEWFLPAHWG